MQKKYCSDWGSGLSVDLTFLETRQPGVAHRLQPRKEAHIIMDKKKRIEALNEKARAIEALSSGEKQSVDALQSADPLNMPVGCSTIFDTGWETNPRPTNPVGNCQPSAHDFLGCAGDCWWPAQNPDGLTNQADLELMCSSISRDWRDVK